MKRPLTLTFAAFLAAACSSIDPQPAATEGKTAVTLAMSEFPGAARMASGFDQRSGDRSWESDDEVLFALRLRKGAEVRRWLLHLRVGLGERLVGRFDNDPAHSISLWEKRTWSYTAVDGDQRRELEMTSTMLPVAATVSDEQGTKLTASIVKLPIHLLGRGVLPAVERALAADQPAAEPGGSRPFREDSIRPMVEATIGMMALLNVVQEDDALAEYFWQVVEKPSVWSVVTSLGVAATLSMPFEKSVPATKLPPDLPVPDRAFVVPLRIDVNGSPALLVELVATDAARPYALCGGIVAAVARHPTKPDVSFELQLLAARLGEQQTRATFEVTAPAKGR